MGKNNKIYGVAGATLVDIPALDYITAGYDLEAVVETVNSMLYDMLDTPANVETLEAAGFQVVYDADRREFLSVSEILGK